MCRSTAADALSAALKTADAVASAWADLCQLAERHTDQLFQHPGTAPLLSADEWTVKSLHHAQSWWAEEARSLAQPTLLSLAGFGQNDVPALSGYHFAVAGNEIVIVSPTSKTVVAIFG